MVKKLLLLLLILLGAYVARESYFYVLVRESLPVGTTIAGVDVAQLTLLEAGERVAEAYAKPIAIYNDTADARADVLPSQLGFELALEEMLAETEAILQEQDWWVGFAGYLLKNPVAPIEIGLQASHNVDKIYEVAGEAARLMSDPALPPRVEPSTLRFLNGEGGYSADIDAAAQNIVNAAYRIEDRSAELPLVVENPPPLDMDMLAQVLEDQIAVHQSLIGSIFVKNLETGEELSINGDLALSGLSVVKIAILLEVYRALDGPPNFDQQKLINETAEHSGNYSANLLLDVVAGQDNAYLGVDILTESMQRLGLVNTYIVTPYEEPDRAGKSFRVPPANSSPENITEPDPSMQTTAEDVGALFAMIYDCSKGGGALLALYPDQLTASECQAVLDVLSLNYEGNLLRLGVPPDTFVAHKHGWGGNTHGDAGVVYSPGADYVIVGYLAEPGSDWLVADFSFPIIRNQSRIVYNFFNPNEPYLVDMTAVLIAEEEAALAAAAAEAAAAEQEAEAELEGDAPPEVESEAGTEASE